MPDSAEVKRAKRALKAEQAGRKSGQIGRPPKPVHELSRPRARRKPKWAELPDDLLEMVLEELPLRDLRCMALAGGCFGAAAAYVLSVRRAALRAEARRKAEAALNERRKAIEAAETRRRSMEGARVLVLLDARTWKARWVEARVEYYVQGAKSSIKGVDSYYHLSVDEDSGPYTLEVWAADKEFASHCCMCDVRMSMCAHCGGAAAAAGPSYVVRELAPMGYVASRPSRRGP